MTPIDLYLKNAQVVTEERVLRGGVLVDGGRIIEVISGDQERVAKQIIDLGGKHLLPGVVDAHVHFNQPGREHWEGYRTGTMAAAAGGVTTALEMPLNATPPTITLANLELKRQAVAGEAVIDYGFWGGLVNNNLSDLESLHREGVIGFKAFMSNSGVDFERVDDDLLYAGLLAIKEMGNLIGVHAENEYVAAYLSRQMRASGRTDRASWYQSRPPAVELEAIQRACHWAAATGGRLHVVHVTIPQGIRAATRAKADGVNVTVETCPHYLFFDEQDFERLGPVAKCAPPIRSRELVEELWACVLEGLVDTIGSDHSPCLWEDKATGMDNIWQAWGGISGIQTMLPAILTEGVNRRGMPLTLLTRLLSANPARIFGLYPQKGAIQAGADADLVVVNIDKEWTLTTDMLLSKNRHSPYVGYSFKGCVERTLVRGTTVYQDGVVIGKPGYGLLLRRNSGAGR
ncbi:MAG: allantoinase AllB [Chloroflexota bacterium]|jgi:allantoinase